MHPFLPDYNVTVDAQISQLRADLGVNDDLPQQNMICTVSMKFDSPMWLDSTSECKLIKNLAACR